MKKPCPCRSPPQITGQAKLIKLGKPLAVGEVALYSDGESEMVAHAAGAYSIPARSKDAAP